MQLLVSADTAGITNTTNTTASHTVPKKPCIQLVTAIHTASYSDTCRHYRPLPPKLQQKNMHLIRALR